MFALKKTKAAPGLNWVHDVPVPKVGPGDVLIAVMYAGICGTDRHIYDWDTWSAARIPLGITIGHEFVGRVVEVGSAVQRVSPGQRVSGEGHLGCNECEPCRTGNGHICTRLQVVGLDRDGTFAQFLVLPQDNVWPVSDAIDDRSAAILDPFGNAVHTVMSAGVSGRKVLVTGVGVIGLMAVAVARAAGAASIIACDVVQRHLDAALEFGADHVLQVDNPQWTQQVFELTDGKGVEVLLEMSGAPAALHGGFSALCNGGTVALLGLPRQPVELDLASEIIFKGATVLGITGRRKYATWFQMEALLATGRIDLVSLVTHEFPIADYEQGFAALASGDAIKVLLAVS